MPARSSSIRVPGDSWKTFDALPWSGRRTVDGAAADDADRLIRPRQTPSTLGTSGGRSLRAGR